MSESPGFSPPVFHEACIYQQDPGLWPTSFMKYPLLVITRAADFLNTCKRNSTSVGLCQLNAFIFRCAIPIVSSNY